jgi:hypothetical protein
MEENSEISAKWRIIKGNLIHVESQLAISVMGKDTNKNFSKNVCTWNKK